MIDWDRLYELRSDIGEEDFADVAFLFVGEMEDELTRLKDAPASASVADFHALRGSAANLGFVAMAEACLRAEHAIKAGEAPDIAALDTVFRQSLAEAAPKMPELVQAA